MKTDTAVIAVMSIAFFGQGMGGPGWSIIPDIAPKRLMGLTGGIFDFTTNIAGIVTPIVLLVPPHSSWRTSTAPTS